MSNEEKARMLGAEEIREGVQKGVKKYEDLTFYEQYAMYMGVAQILELQLKKLFEEKFGGNLDDMERWPLGKTVLKLEKKGLRPDFIDALKQVKDSRNHIVHELLASELLTNGLMEKYDVEGFFSKNHRFLWKAIDQIENVTFVFEWLNENNGWE